MKKKIPPSLGIRHIALKVHDIRKAEDFYVRILGFKPEWRPDTDNLYLTSGLDNLALHQVSFSLKMKENSLDHFGILVKDPHDVDDWAQYLKTQGMTLSKEPKTHRDGARSIYFQDPDGNLIQILYHPPISKNSSS